MIVLFDLSPEPLEVASRGIARARVKRTVRQITEGSITDLSMFEDGHFDAVLCLGGPVSHVHGEEARQNAVCELARIAKKGAPVAMSCMGRLGVLASCPRHWGSEIEDTQHFREMSQEGKDYQWRGGCYCHFFMPGELERLVAG